jgi:hypothetical protein
MAANSPISGAGPLPDLMTLIVIPEGVTVTVSSAEEVNGRMVRAVRVKAALLRSWERVSCWCWCWAEREVVVRDWGDGVKEEADATREARRRQVDFMVESV